ncbi:MAG: CDP-glucose 4,6-dehydratase [Bacillota bacterium]
MGKRGCTVEDLGMTEFYRGKRVFVTGHTGFKGAWLCKILLCLGAEVTGYALAPEEESLYDLCGVARDIRSVIGDIRDTDTLGAAFLKARPDIVLHLAAQPLVMEGYRDPAQTYAVNVMGTVHLLDCIRRSDSVGSVVNVTTDKVYRNEEWPWGYRETDILDGRDPYSNSKSCSELVTHCYRDSFFSGTDVGISTLRAGNVIGGGDFAKDRLIPDCVRAALAGRHVHLRNPGATRPYQHVLEPLFAYLLAAKRQYRNPEAGDSYNVGPDEAGCVGNVELVRLFCECWGEGMSWTAGDASGFPEANLLRLDSSKIRAKLGWRARWSIETAVEKTVEWAKARRDGGDMEMLTMRQIDEYRTGGEADV